ncbi:MAG TPA: cell wall-binding repeat-containing protein [Nocardioidaceae bacterium]|nr:cell wall-binding repeat-containing protein [Nocardioidaceae bacterium]
MALHAIARRAGFAGVAATLAISGGLVATGPADAAAHFQFTRISGANRYETSAKVADQFGSADTVILASGEPGHYPDALTASYLAGLDAAPVLLTHENATPDVIKAAIAKTGASKVVIVGGTNAISQAQQDNLEGTYTVTRVSGSDRYATAASVIDQGDEAQGSTALLATGLNFPDALGAGPIAFAEQMPLAITRTDKVPDTVVAALQKAGISQVLILGGTGAVSDSVVDQLKQAGITVAHRFSGSDRAETSELVADYAIDNYGFHPTSIDVASGDNGGDGADALGGGELAGQQQTPMLITDSTNTPGAGVLKFLSDHSATLLNGTIFGGDAAVSASAEDTMTKTVLGHGAENVTTGEYYDTVQQAVTAASAGDTIDVFGTNAAGFTVDKPLTITGDSDAVVNGAIVVQNADDVTISNLSITPGTFQAAVAGIYVDTVNNLTIKNDVIDASGATGSRGVINAAGGGDEVVTLTGNVFRNLTTGVLTNPTAQFTIDGNTFRNDTAASGNDADGQVITNNTFVDNDEAIGLAGPGTDLSTVTGNSFANSSNDHVGDYTATKAYDLQQMIQDNTFDEPVVVTSDDTYIKDADQVS